MSVGDGAEIIINEPTQPAQFYEAQRAKKIRAMEAKPRRAALLPLFDDQDTVDKYALAVAKFDKSLKSIATVTSQTSDSVNELKRIVTRQLQYAIALLLVVASSTLTGLIVALVVLVRG